MTFDGARAIITGDYIRPKTGDYAGQLGPWTHLVEKIGIDPMSTLMKSICFALDVRWAWHATVIFSVGSAWNLLFGTMNSILQIILLAIVRIIK